jgi:hypothetical protein
MKIAHGSLVLIADPSILINSMLPMEGNAQFVKNIIEIDGPGPRVLVDSSHLPGASLDKAKEVLARARSTLSTPVGITVVLAAALALILSPIWRKVSF